MTSLFVPLQSMAKLGELIRVSGKVICMGFEFSTNCTNCFKVRRLYLSANVRAKATSACADLSESYRMHMDSSGVLINIPCLVRQLVSSRLSLRYYDRLIQASKLSGTLSLDTTAWRN